MSSQRCSHVGAELDGCSPCQDSELALEQAGLGSARYKVVSWSGGIDPCCFHARLLSRSIYFSFHTSRPDVQCGAFSRYWLTLRIRIGGRGTFETLGDANWFRGRTHSYRWFLATPCGTTCSVSRYGNVLPGLATSIVLGVHKYYGRSEVGKGIFNIVLYRQVNQVTLCEVFKSSCGHRSGAFEVVGDQKTCERPCFKPHGH